MQDNNKSIKIHFFYVTVMLIGGIILIATDRWTGQQDFTSYLSNAATITSLLLGLIAIFYSFISNNGLSRSLGNISAASDNINLAKDEISNHTMQAKAAVSIAAKSTDSLNAISAEINESANGLKIFLTDFSAKTEQMLSAISVIPVQLKTMESNLIEATTKAETRTKETEQSSSLGLLSEEKAIEFVKKSVLSQHFFTLACLLSKESNKAFQLEWLSKAANYRSKDFYLGCYFTMDSAGIIAGSFKTTESSEVRISRISTGIAGILNSEIDRSIEQISGDEIKESAKKTIQVIKNYFNSQMPTGILVRDNA